MTIKIITSCRKLLFSEDVIFICLITTFVIATFTLLIFTKIHPIIVILQSMLAAYIGVGIFIKLLYPIIQRNDNFISN